jgi:hypothetical protein
MQRLSRADRIMQKLSRADRGAESCWRSSISGDSSFECGCALGCIYSSPSWVGILSFDLLGFRSGGLILLSTVSVIDLGFRSDVTLTVKLELYLSCVASSQRRPDNGMATGLNNWIHFSWIFLCPMWILTIFANWWSIRDSFLTAPTLQRSTGEGCPHVYCKITRLSRAFISMTCKVVKIEIIFK